MTTSGVAGRKAYQMPEKSIILKELILQCGINQTNVSEITGVARTTINLCLNRGYIPTTSKDFQKKIESFISKNQRAMHWLIERGLKPSDLWAPAYAEGFGGQADKKHRMPAGHGANVAAGQKKQAFIQGDPMRFVSKVEVEMITSEAMKHFKIFRHPFIDDIQKDSDIYMSEEHRYIEAAMLDCARHSGFLAVIGEVGSGKSVIRRKVVEQLRKDGDILIIYPQIIDKKRITAASICDAIIMDISSEKTKIKLEQKARQVQQLLLERSKQNYRSVLIIEEAHDLPIEVLKYLKRFYELEDGYRKLLGIILMGQIELKYAFNEAQHVDLREVIRRVQVAEIAGLNGHIKEYLNLKFKRVGGEMDKIFDNGALSALGKRLTSKDRQNKTISHAYPLLVNNYAAKAMNMACEMGESKVTENVVMAI